MAFAMGRNPEVTFSEKITSMPTLDIISIVYVEVHEALNFKAVKRNKH